MTTAEQAQALRKPFAPEEVGKLPRVYCRNCGEAKKRGGGSCDQHKKVKCRVCNNNITEAHLHLDYVGHAETTDRFLQVDPDWSWEPVAFGDDGLPRFDKDGGLWIRLTIGGTTRLGYGAADGKTGPDAVKEVIGDALRNAGMRFGVGLDLWGAKFKDSDPDEPDGAVHGRNAADAWESAQPARTVTQASTSARAIELFKLVTTADSLDALKAAWELAEAAVVESTITGNERNSLSSHVKKRKAELSTPAALQEAQPGDQPAAEPIPDTPMDARQRAKLFALFTSTGLKERDAQMSFLYRVTGRELASRNDLTADEADQAIGALEAQKKQGAGRTNGHLTAVPA